MKLSIASLLFATVSFAAEIAPPTFGPTAYSVTNPVVASNGSTFLTLWTFSSRHVYGSLADANGNVITRISFPVVPKATIQDLFRYGNGYIAIIATNNALQVAFISSDGRLLRLGATLPGSATSYGVTRAFNGSSFFTLQHGSAPFPPGETVGQIVSLTGQVIRDKIVVGGYGAFAVTTAGNDFVTVISGAAGVFVQRFTADGKEIWPSTKIADASPATAVAIAIASSGNDIAVVWSTYKQTGAADTFVVLLAGNGTPISRTQIGPEFFASPRVVWTGSEYVLIGGAGLVATMTSDGRLNGPTRILPSDFPAATIVAGSNRILFAAAVTGTYPSQRVEGLPITIAAPIAAHERVVLSITLTRQLAPVIATDGFEFLTVWADEAADGARILATRLTRLGTPLDAAPIHVATTSQSVFGLSPWNRGLTVASGSTTYLVVWSSGRDVLGRRIDRFGNLLDPQPLVLATQAMASDQAVAWNGTAFVVVFGQNGSLSRVVVNENGTVSSPLRLPIHANTYAPSIAWAGDRFLVVAPVAPPCTVSACPPGPPVGLIASQLTREGDVFDEQVAIISPASTWSYHIASSGRDVMIASDVLSYGSGAIDYRVELRSVRTNGAALDVSSPVTAFHWFDYTMSNIAWDGQQYVVASRYGIADQQWVRVMHFGADQTVEESSYINSGLFDAFESAAIAPGMLVTSEVRSAGGVARVYSDTESETRPLPHVPPAPLITSAVGTGTRVTITWLTAPIEVAGFIIEKVNPFLGIARPIAVLPPDARSATLASSFWAYSTLDDFYVRMKTVNVAGISEPTAAVRIIPPPKNRAVHH